MCVVATECKEDFQMSQCLGKISKLHEELWKSESRQHWDIAVKGEAVQRTAYLLLIFSIVCGISSKINSPYRRCPSG